MSVAKVIEISAASQTSFEDAVQQGIKKANETIDQVKGAWIKEQKIVVDNNRITEYRVDMLVTFVLK